jgi:hypothetical protein
MTSSPSNIYSDILRNDLCAFIYRCFVELSPHTPSEHNWHLEVLVSKLEEVRLRRCKRLIINIPPRHLKSFIGSVVFPAWLLGHDPAKQILAISYAQDLSDKFARDSQALITTPFYQSLFGTRLSADRNAVAEFETTEGGYRLSTSVGGAITGRGADVIIVDDPIKADEALSDLRRQAVNAWYDNTPAQPPQQSRTGRHHRHHAEAAHGRSCGPSAADRDLGCCVTSRDGGER